jgi:hypothetical protein
MLAAAIQAVCGGSPRAQDVINDFGVHRKLGWQLWNVAYAAGPFDALRNLPNQKSLDAWRSAALQKGVPQELLEQFNESLRQFESVADRHAQDREMLEMMLEAADPQPNEAADLRWRKLAFNGNVYIWGIRARTLLATVLLHPSEQPGRWDLARLQGLIGLVRTRPNVRWPFAQSVVPSDQELGPASRAPLVDSPAVRETGVPLMEEFCTGHSSIPPVARRRGALGLVEDELLPGPVGAMGASTVITGEIIRAAGPIAPSQPGQHALFGTGVRTPAEVLISDHFVHRDLWPGVRRELRVFSELISQVSQDARDVLTVSERIQPMGRGLARVRTAEVPRYAEMLGRIFERTGWNPDDFDVFRVRMRYPPIPVSVMVRHEMPPPAD